MRKTTVGWVFSHLPKRTVLHGKGERNFPLFQIKTCSFQSNQLVKSVVCMSVMMWNIFYVGYKMHLETCESHFNLYKMRESSALLGTSQVKRVFALAKGHGQVCSFCRLTMLVLLLLVPLLWLQCRDSWNWGTHLFRKSCAGFILNACTNGVCLLV